MQIEGSRERLEELIFKQLEFFLITTDEVELIGNTIGGTLEDLERSFNHCSNKYYRKNDEAFFNPLHSAQYCIFLYKLSRSVFEKTGETAAADKIYCLNKMLNSCDLFYGTKLPNIFFTDHPLGAVLGKADYGERFSFRQGCTVGNNKGKYPRIGSDVKMWSNSKILGDCEIGNNVIVSSGSYIKDQNVPSNSIVFGASPNLVFKSNSSEKITS
jgi:serine O-acetyltransferase